MLAWFEKLIHPFPDNIPKPPPRGFAAFIWACSQGLRRYILGMTLLTAIIGAFEALLFAMMGRIIDWLSDVPPAQLWVQEGHHLMLLGLVLAASVLVVALQTMVKHQTLAGPFRCCCAGNFTGSCSIRA